MSNKGLDENSKVVSTKEISEILGLSDRRIRQLENEGALVKIAHGKFHLPDSIQRYIEFIKEQSEPDEETDYYKERALLTRANRQKAEMELKIIQGEVHRSEDVEKVMNDMLGAFRSRTLVIPNKISPLLIAQTEVEVVKSIIKKAIHEALLELSDYDPQVFYAKSKDKLSLADPEETDGEEIKGPEGKGPLKNAKRKKKK